MNNHTTVHVLIVGNNGLSGQLYHQILSDVVGIHIDAIVNTEQEACTKMAAKRPDILIIDAAMPEMENALLYDRLMQEEPIPTLIATTAARPATERALAALVRGAFDCVLQPMELVNPAQIIQLKAQLVAKIRAAAQSRLQLETLAMPDIQPYDAPESTPPVIAIGAANGGVVALHTLFAQLPGNAPPIVVSQHLPEALTGLLAEHLGAISALQVREARDGDPVVPGVAYIAPGDRHLTIAREQEKLVCRFSEEIWSSRPSVDALFNSVADSMGANAVGIVLSGAGRDGAGGLLKMRRNGAHTIAQDEASSMLYSMPEFARSIGAVTTELPLSSIAGHLLQHCAKRESAA